MSTLDLRTSRDTGHEVRRLRSRLEAARLEQSRQRAQVQLTRDVLARTLTDASLHDVLDVLGRGVERLCPDAVCSVLLVEDGLLRDAAGPRLPERYRRAIDGLAIGPDVGSCGSAAFSGRPVVVTSIATDPRWEPYRALAAAVGFRACWSHPFLDADGDVLGTFAMYYRTEREPRGEELRLLEDCADLAQMAVLRSTTVTRLRHLALTDVLTGLSNRAEVLRAVDSALGEGTCSVLFVDLDRFKMINDSLGHSAGDAYLVEVAARLVRAAPRDATVGRVGGDEFVVVCPSVPTRDAEELAREVNAVLTQPIDVSGRPISLGASIGVASGSGAVTTAEDLLREADTAMYVAKHGGRNGHAVFDEALRDGALERLELDADLRRALREGQLRIVYQPKVHLRDGRICGFEALIRWHHPERGPVEPSRFIPLAEEIGIISEIGEWVIRQACAQLAQWRRTTPAARDLRIWVNVSARQLRDQDLPAVVGRALHDAGLEPWHLGLEITESALGDETACLDALHRLKAVGVRIALDDFGTGYSSLARLKRLPFDVIKIDQSFVAGLTIGRKDRGVVRSIVELSAALGISNVAEGVETREQQALLRELGCEYAQGYLFAAPLDPSDVPAALR